MIQQLTRIRPGVVRFAFSMLALLGLVLVSTSAQAQETIRFSRPGPIRLTVSVNTTNTGVVTNLVNVGGTVTSGITLSVSNLPAGCGYDMATNGVSVGTTVVITNDVALSVTVNSTNVVESEYTFYVTATGDATNQFPYTLQSCYVWNTNILAPAAGHLANFATASSWKDGVGPGATSLHDIFFGTSGSQTNVDSSGIPATNINITANTQVGSIRVGVGTEPDLGASRSQHILIAGNTTLSVVSNRGFTVLRDYITEYASGDRRSKLHISGGGNGARLLVTNANANFALLMDSGTSGENVINMTNLQTFEVNVRRFGLGDYQLYPNYRAMNLGSNSSDGLGGIPRKFMTTVILARSNFITATYQSPDNYANDTTREYGIRWLNSEMSGNGSSENNQLHFGFTNIIKSDAVCFVGGNMASGNSGFARFRAGQNNNSAIFRSAGGGRMSLFTISDGGGTNEERSNIKANIDFWGGQSANNIDIVTTNFYIARDRAWIQSSNTVNYAGSFTMGKGTNDTINTILGYQEHQVRLNDVLQAGKQLGYCQGTVIITNGGVFKVANQLTLGYTADTNAVGVAELYNNFGRVSVNNGGQLIVNKVVVDGGPRNYSHTEGNDRNDSISLNEATLVLTNTIGAAPGQPLNSYSTTKSTNTWHVGVDKTNLVCRTLSTPGTAASVIKVASISGVTTLPATLPIISYETASSPYLQADMTGNGTTNGYLLNNTANSTINLYLTTNAPKTLLWTGSQDNNWDYATKNWVLVGGSGPTNFAIGDIVIFDDSSTVTNVNVSGEVVPGQSGAGVTVSNIVRQYTFSGGTVAGTSLLLKRGSGQAVFTCTKQGPVTMLEGSMNVGSGGTIGLLTLASNTFVNVSGAINGGLTSTGAVQVVSGGTVDGPINIAAGWVNNDGTISSSPGSIVLNQLNPLLLTNSASGIINQWGAQWTLGTNSVLCNMGTINNLQNRLNVAGFMYGTGTVADPDGTGGGGGPFPAGIDGRLEVRPGTATMLSPGATPFGSIGTMTVNTRFDLSGVDNSGGWATMLVEVDKSNPQTNDQVLTYFFSNMAGKLIMSNINLSMPFAAGDAFQVIKSSNPIGPDNKAGEGPQIEPFIPGPGLVWDLSDFRTNGWIKVTSNARVWAGSVNSTWDTGITANWAGGSTYSN
ncbi:MAG: hypothetical protein RLY20_2430, partial [Verrucomicrobiota bacterium]